MIRYARSPALDHRPSEQRSGSRCGRAKQIREAEMVDEDGMLELTVDLITATSHQVPLSKLKAWLESGGRDPREAAIPPGKRRSRN